jgi:hypothetical protein
MASKKAATKDREVARAVEIFEAAANFKIPTTMGACADELHALREHLHHLNAEVELVKAHVQAITNHLIEELPKDDAEGVVGKLVRATVEMRKVPTVGSWPKLWKHIIATGSFDLMEKRVSKAAVKERWEAGKKVPGVDVFNVPTISLTKRR